jgi:hypothetical protein
MKCEAFLQEWSSQHDGCESDTLSTAAQAHLATCATCQMETVAMGKLDNLLSQGLAERAQGMQPRPLAVNAAVMAAVAAVEERQPATRPTTPRLKLITGRQEPLRFVPATLGVARWAIAATLIVAATLLSRGQPFGATPTYADATATAAAIASPSVTPSATLSASVPGTPAVVSMARPSSTPVPH